MTAISVTPATPNLALNATQQFTAVAKDQFGAALTSQPSFTWSVPGGGGSVNSTGLYTAAGTAGSATVRATSGSVQGNASVTVANQAPTVATEVVADLFFFQAEDGIRDLTVTGVQTCALPI